jgi:phosphate transport system substrate-binding protein
MARFVNRRVIVAGLFASVTAARAQQPALSGRLVVTGSSTIAPLMLEITKAFEKRHPGVRIDVQTGGSSRGIADVRNGLASIGMVSRALTDAEIDIVGVPIARDGIGLIAHKSNPLASLDEQAVADIFTGRITDWKAVGGAPGRVSIVNKAEGRSTLELFLQHFKLKNSEIKASVVIGDNAQGLKTVAGAAGAIGYVSIGAAEFEVEQGALIKLIALGGVKPSSAAVQNGSYPLSRPLTLVTKAKPDGLAASLIAFARSNESHTLIREQFFVPLQS